MNDELQKILDYYGANLDDSVEPDESPESEGIVTLPTPEEERRAHNDWEQKVRSWNNDGGEEL